MLAVTQKSNTHLSGSRHPIIFSSSEGAEQEGGRLQVPSSALLWCEFTSHHGNRAPSDSGRVSGSSLCGCLYRCVIPGLWEVVPHSAKCRILKWTHSPLVRGKKKKKIKCNSTTPTGERIRLRQRRFPQSMWQVGSSAESSGGFKEVPHSWHKLFCSSSFSVSQVLNLHECPAGIPHSCQINFL